MQTKIDCWPFLTYMNALISRSKLFRLLCVEQQIRCFNIKIEQSFQYLNTAENWIRFIWTIRFLFLFLMSLTIRMHRFVYKFLLTIFFKFIDNLFFCNGQTFVCDFKGPLIDKFPYGQTHFCLPMVVWILETIDDFISHHPFYGLFWDMTQSLLLFKLHHYPNFTSRSTQYYLNLDQIYPFLQNNLSSYM